MNEQDKLFELKNDRTSSTVLNQNLTSIEREIFEAIKYSDIEKLTLLGADAELDLNFLISISTKQLYSPLMLAATIGNIEVVKELLKNRSIDVNVTDNESGVNAFWLAAYFGRGKCLSLLAEKQSNILVKHSLSKQNALHASIANKHYSIASQLIKSNFPLNERTDEGLTAMLMIAYDRSKEAIKIAKDLITYGADIDIQTDIGYSPLFICVVNDNKHLAELLIDNEAMIFNEHKKDLSPFFVAIRIQKIWAVEKFIDHGADMDTKLSDGTIPIFYAQKLGYDDVCMYLSLRC